MANKKTSNKNKKKLQKLYATTKPSSASGEYVVGTLGDMVVQSSCGGAEPEFDPKLASLFSKPTKSLVPVKVTRKKLEEAMPAPPIREKFNVGKRAGVGRQNGDGLVKHGGFLKDDVDILHV